MAWFLHSHVWREMEVSTVKGENGGVAGRIVLQECGYCSAVRTIEYGPGRDPVIRLVDPADQSAARA